MGNDANWPSVSDLAFMYRGPAMGTLVNLCFIIPTVIRMNTDDAN